MTSRSTLTIPFYAIKVVFNETENFLITLNDNYAIRIDEAIWQFAGEYAEKLQHDLVKKNNYKSILERNIVGDFVLDTIQISFPITKEKKRPTVFLLDIQYFKKTNNRNWVAYIPSLKLQAVGIDEEDLQKNIIETVRISFAMDKRLHDVRQMISALWLKTVSIDKEKISLYLPAINDSEFFEEKEVTNNIIDKVAVPIEINKQQVFEYENYIEAFTKSLRSHYNKNVLLVGPGGVGKTALVWEMAYRSKKYGIQEQIRETTASVLIKELTGQFGWQEQLTQLCQEFKKKGDFLFIRSLMELFEVGQYEGNNESMGVFLRRFIAKGDIHVISECTEEELANIELRSPGLTSFFQIIRMNEPIEKLEAIILNKIEYLCKNKNVKIAPDAITEAIRLHKRFVPYSGFPGKPIRFLEGILINNHYEEETLINQQDIFRFFCEETGMPQFMIDPGIPMDTVMLKSFFNNNVFGQSVAINSVVDILVSVKTALTRSGKPIASFLFVGPTGVGKTELAKALADKIFGDRNKIMRFDMSEYSNPIDVLRLTGLNYFTDGILTSAIRQEPFCVLLFDEIEKAHNNFNDLLLQLLGEGRLSDSKGTSVNFCSTIIIMTSNIGAASFQKGNLQIGQSKDNKSINAHFLSSVQKYFRPEIYNRIDLVIPFEPLNKETVRHVVEREIALLRKREGIYYRKISLNITDEVLDYLAVVSYDERYGARQLQRTITNELLLPLSAKLNEAESEEQLLVEVTLQDNAIDILVDIDPLGFDLLFEQLNKINAAELISKMRRRMQSLQEGNFYLKIINEYEILVRKGHRKNNNTFWQDKESVQMLNNLQNMIAKTNTMAQQINKMEMDFSLACLDLAPFYESMVDELNEKEQSIVLLKREMVKSRFPNVENCNLYIYGKEPEFLLNVYVPLCDKKEFIYVIEAIWYNHQYYHDTLDVVVNSTDKDDNPVEVTTKKARMEYKFSEVKYKNGKYIFIPDNEEDILVGVILKIKGDCALLYLAGEAGKQTYNVSDKEKYDFIVNPSKDVIPILPVIHRTQFFNGSKSRRIFTPSVVSDSIYKIKKDVSKKNFSEYLTEVCDQLFENNLDNIIFT